MVISDPEKETRENNLFHLCRNLKTCVRQKRLENLNIIFSNSKETFIGSTINKYNRLENHMLEFQNILFEEVYKLVL